MGGFERFQVSGTKVTHPTPYTLHSNPQTLNPLKLLQWPFVSLAARCVVDMFQLTKGFFGVWQLTVTLNIKMSPITAAFGDPLDIVALYKGPATPAAGTCGATNDLADCVAGPRPTRQLMWAYTSSDENDEETYQTVGPVAKTDISITFFVDSAGPTQPPKFETRTPNPKPETQNPKRFPQEWHQVYSESRRTIPKSTPRVPRTKRVNFWRNRPGGVLPRAVEPRAAD